MQASVHFLGLRGAGRLLQEGASQLPHRHPGVELRGIGSSGGAHPAQHAGRVLEMRPGVGVGVGVGGGRSGGGGCRRRNTRAESVTSMPGKNDFYTTSLRIYSTGSVLRSFTFRHSERLEQNAARLHVPVQGTRARVDNTQEQDIQLLHRTNRHAEKNTKKNKLCISKHCHPSLF